jgi:hypothetical protein
LEKKEPLTSQDISKPGIKKILSIKRLSFRKLTGIMPTSIKISPIKRRRFKHNQCRWIN